MFPYFKHLFALLGVSALLIACTPTPGQSAAVNGDSSNPKLITVTGHGQVFGQPDSAQLTLGVEIFRETAQEAVDANENAIRTLRATLAEQGVADEDIQTSNYSLWVEQIYGERGPEGIAGYRVNNQMLVTFRQIDRIGEILAAVTNAGANNIYGMAFTVSDPTELRNEARVLAIANARTRAEFIALQSGLTLGEITNVQEFSEPNYGPAIGGMGGGGGQMANEVGISPGQLGFNTQIQVTFAIE